MPYIKGSDRSQITLMPNALDDYVSDQNPVRIIDAFAERLDMASIGFKSVAAIEGCPGYDPRDMLKLYIYGYQNKIRSSRKLQTECSRNIEVMWLMGRLIPDFRCISDFRKDNAAAIKKVFHSFVALCNNAGLLSKELVAFDGSKFRAVNSQNNSYVKKQLEKTIKELDEKISKYMAELDKNDTEEKASHLNKDEIKCLLERLKDKKIRLDDAFNTLVESGENQICLTDPECRIMKTGNGFKPCFNVQTAVESKNHIIVDFNVTNDVTDKELLAADLQSAKKVLKTETLEGVFDKGYRSGKQVLNSLLNGDTPNVYTPDKQDCYSFEFEKTEAEIAPEMLASKDPDIIKQCVSAGILPDSLKKESITIEVSKGRINRLYMDVETGELVSKSQTTESINADREKPLSYYFVRDLEKDTVTCPMGKMLLRAGNSHSNSPHYSKNARYVRPSVCRDCTNKCIAGKFRNVIFKDGQTEKRATFYDDCLSGKPVRKIKENYIPVDIPNSERVILRFCPDYKKLRLRSSIVEHPYGTVKRWNDGYYLLVKGKLKAAADLAFSFLGYNFKRVLNLLGFEKMLALMNA